MKPKSTLRLFLALAGSSLLAVSFASAQATSNTWDTDAAGNWTDVLNWTGDAAYAEGADNTATLGNVITNNRTITLNADITIGNITASDATHNYTISGANILTLDRTTGTPTIHVANGSSGRTLIIASTIAGNDGLNKTGRDTLALSGTNNYIGTTTISQGTLNLGNSGSTGSLASTALALGGGTLSYTRTGSQTQNFSTTTINAGSSSVSTVAGNTLGLGDITQSAGGTLNVGTVGIITTSDSNVNNILGPWAFLNTGSATTYATVSGGTIFGLTYSGGTTGTTAAAAANLTTDATENFSFTGGSGALGGSSFNTLRYTGATGTMTGAFTANGIMNAGSGTLTFSNAVTIGSTNELVVNAANNNIIFSSAIGENATASFTKIGTGSVTLNGNNTYTGLTVVGAGTLNVNQNNALGSSAGVNSHTILPVTGSQTARINVNTSITTAENITITGETENGNYFSPLTASGSGATQGTYSGTITLAGSGAIRIGPANWTGTITQSGTSHKLIFVGANTVSNAMTINGADVTVSNGTTRWNAVNGTGIGSTDIYADTTTATLILGATDALRTDRDLSYNGTNTMRLNLNGNNQTIRGLISSGSGTRTVNNDATGTTSTLTVGNGGGDYSFAGTIINNTTGTGTVALTKTGAGTQTLTGISTYTGATTITEGTLKLGANDVLPNGSAVSIGTATLDADTRTDTLGTLDVTGSAVINLGSGAALAFADSSAGGSGTWAGTLNITGTLDATSLKFGTSSSGLTSAQLAKISVNNSGLGTYTLDASGYLIPGGPDTTAPTLVSIVDDKSGGTVTVGTLVTYTVTFSEDIADGTVTSADFSNAGSSSITFGTITETSPGVFTVQITPTSTGSLILQIPTTASITDNATSPNALDNDPALVDDTTITVNPSDPYLAWAGPGVLFDADANSDGVDNGLAFLLGASGPNVSALDKLPVPTQSAGALVLTFQMLDDTANGNATLAIEYSNSLAGGSWTAVQVPYSSGTVGDIGFNVTGSGPLNVTATIPLSKAAGGKLFGRVKALNP